MRIQHKNLTIRQAEVADAKQLAAWWNDGAVMAHAGFPNGLGTTEEEVVKGLRNGLLVVEESDRLIGECNYTMCQMVLQKSALRSAKPIVRTVVLAERF